MLMFVVKSNELLRNFYEYSLIMSHIIKIIRFMILQQIIQNFFIV